MEHKLRFRTCWVVGKTGGAGWWGFVDLVLIELTLARGDYNFPGWVGLGWMRCMTVATTGNDPLYWEGWIQKFRLQALDGWLDQGDFIWNS